MYATYHYKLIRFPYFLDYDHFEEKFFNEGFAAYATDASFGLKLRIEDFPEDQYVDHIWHQSVVAANGLVITRADIRFRNEGTLRRLYYQYYSADGEPLGWINVSDETPDMGSNYITGALSASTLDEYRGALDTASAYFEYRRNGIVVASGSLGNGFEIRGLYIPELQASSPVVNLNEPEQSHLSLSGEIFALPVGWTPVSDLTFFAGASGNATIAYLSLPVSGPGANGLIASFDLQSLDSTWDGRNNSGHPLSGLHTLNVSASGRNPDVFETYSNAANGGTVYVTGCPQDSVQTCRTVDGVRFYYSSQNHISPPKSLGYGWSSDSSIRIVVSGDDIYLRTASGTSLRWKEDNGTYSPFQEGNYTELSQDGIHWKATSKDQTSSFFNLSDGRLVRVQDRNLNTVHYNYDSNGHMSSIVDENGRSISFVNRPDGQPDTMIVNGINTRVTEFQYYSDSHPVSPNRLHSIKDPEDNRTMFSYDTDGRMLSVTDPQGNSVYYEYDEFGRVTREQYGDQMVRTYEYSEIDHQEVVEVNILESSFVEPEYRQTYLYRDSLGRLLSTNELVEDPPGNPFERVYRETFYEYNDPVQEPFIPNPYLVTVVTDNNFNITETTYTEDGNIKTVKDKAGNITTYVYAEEIELPLNPKHRNLVREIHRSSVTVDGSTVTYDPLEFEYDFNGNLERMLDSKGQETTMTFDDDGLVLDLTDRNGNTTEFVYDGDPHNGDRRNLLQIKVPKGSSALDGFRTVYFTYDAFDNIVSVQNDLGHEILTTYDGIHRPLTVENARNFVTSYSYEDLLLKEVSLPANNGSGGLTRTTSWNYDTSNRLTEVTRDINALQDQQMVVGYQYTGYSQIKSLKRLKDGVENLFRFSYDKTGRVVESTDNLQNTSTTAYEPFCLGNAHTSAREIRRRVNFEPRCLVSQLEVGEVDPTDPLEVLNPRETHSWEHDELGRLVRSNKSRSSRYRDGVSGLDSYGTQEEERTYLYDELDRLIEMTYEDGSTASWEYDAEGNVTKYTDPEGKITRYEYYRDDLLHKVIIERGDPATVVGEFVYSYDAAGRLDQIAYPASTGITAVFRNPSDTPGSGFDPNGNIRYLRYMKTGETDPIRSFEWTYDDSDNRQSMLDVTPGKAVQWEYGYDWLDRLVTVKRAEAADAGSLPATALQRQYVFDESDNRVFFDDHVNGATYHYVYKSIDDNGTTRYSDQIEEILISTTVGDRNLANFVSFETFEHDEDGNMTKRTLASTGEEISYEWTELDRLKRVESDTNGRRQNARYGVDGLRTKKQDAAGNSSREYGVGISTSASTPLTQNSTAPSISYISGPVILGAEIDGEFVYHLGDALSTVRDVVDDQGDVIRSFEFDEYGNMLNSSGTGAASPKTWIGGLSVNDDRDDSGLWNMGHRNYDGGVLGRFISRDPIGHAGGLNLYSYSTSPVDLVDPSGLTPVYTDNPAGALPPGWTMTVQPDGVNAYSNQSLSLIADIRLLPDNGSCPETSGPLERRSRVRPKPRRRAGWAPVFPDRYEIRGIFGPDVYPPNEFVMRAILERNSTEAAVYSARNSKLDFDNLNWLERKLAGEWDYEDENFRNFNKGVCGAALHIPVETLISDGYRPGYGYNRQTSPIAERAIRRGYAYGSRGAR